ncbi:MAG: gamma carbonic anhydrase family protein [Planctomycetota bacterium]
MSDQSTVRLGRGVYIAPTAYVGGDVVLGDRCTVMHHVAIRGDIAAIRIGARCNVQDGAVVHTQHDCSQIIGDDVGIGHRAVVHGRRIGSRVLIGIGAIILDDCEIGDECVIAAGAVLTPGTIIGPGKVVMGVPAAVVREATAADGEYAKHVIESYLELGRLHAAGRFPAWDAPSGNGISE